MFSESRLHIQQLPRIGALLYKKSELLSLVMPWIQMHFSSKPINNKRKQLTFLNTLRN